MVPTLADTLGVKGHRPLVGTRDNKDLLYVFAVVNLATAALHTNLLDSPTNAKAKAGKSNTRRMQEAFPAYLRHIGRMDLRGRNDDPRCQRIAGRAGRAGGGVEPGYPDSRGVQVNRR